jgi:PKD repeat protein
MAEKLYASLILLFSFIVLQGQNPGIQHLNEHGLENAHPHEQCAHASIHERMMLEDVQYRQEQEQREQFLEGIRSGAIAVDRSNMEIYTVPVVVHIIHDGDALGTGSNISDEQVFSAINGLNEDFRKMAGTNGDGDGEDIGVEFCLAQRDPSGNATNGINRVNGCSVPLYCTQGITAGNGQGANELAVKNLSRWPNQDYYNIWVVTEIENNNGGSGIQGYAYFPTTSPVDGTVLLFNAFGTVGNLKSYTDMNRTVTHELGHAFALFHTFQGGTCSETNCNLQGDRVCDTPPTTLNSSCNNPACGGTQLVENYMDYTSETCKNMFTAGQRDRMRQAISFSRSNLINSNGCEPVVAVQADAGITEIIEPYGNLCDRFINPRVELSNLGSTNLSTVTIQYRTGGSWQNHNWAGLLGPGQSTEVILPAYDGGWGMRNLEVRTSNPNGNTDANPSNNSHTQNYNAVQNGHEITVAITLDALGGQTTWELRSTSNELLASGGPYSNFQAGTVETEIICVDDGCYDFVMMDSNGNGICCNNGNGSYSVTDENNNVLASGGNFGSEEITEICVNPGGPPPVADFTVNNTTVCAGESLTFTNLTTGDVDSYLWEFFGGSPLNATAENPGQITYNTPGTYNVRLTATNAFGQDVELKTNYITVVSSLTWYQDSDGDTYGNPNVSQQSCTQPPGYVSNNEDCDDSNPNDWNSCYDCAGTYNGTAQLDNCGTCDTNPNNDCQQDCAGVWGGTAVEDNCGTCDSNPNNDCVQDCAGVWGGTAVLDNCGTCDSNPNNDCVQDCAGVWGGSAELDNCGTCDTNPNNDCEQDCAGVWGGSAVLDNCGTCDSNPNNDCEQDCLGQWGGTAVLDNCGTCDSNPDNDCEQDCAGEWGGSAYFDDCGTCDDNPANDCVPCEELSIDIISVTEPSCFGTTDGAITVSVNSLSGNPTIEWQTGQTGTELVNLSAGSYQLTVEEDDCVAFVEIVLDQPDELQLSVLNIENIDCGEEDTGEAEIEISGGTTPYSLTLNGTDLEDYFLMDLPEDNYLVEVVDANGCTDSFNFSIITLDCDTLGNTALEGNLCAQETLDIFEPATCQPVANADFYEWRFLSGGNSEELFRIETPTTTLLPYEYAEIQPFQTYLIEVRGMNSYNPSVFGERCEVVFSFSSTRLIDSDCGNINLYLQDEIRAIQIPEIDEYEFRFEDVLTGERSYAYSQADASTLLSDNPDLEDEKEYFVNVKGRFNGVWGDFGETCSIFINPVTLTTSLTSEWCGNTEINITSDVILVQPLPNASVYQLKLSNQVIDTTMVFESETAQFEIATLEGIQTDLNYSAQARALINGLWTAWGVACEIAAFDPDDHKLNMMVFPNPMLQGESVQMMTKGNWENLDLRIYNQMGVELKSARDNFTDMNPKSVNLSFLESGIYFIHVSHGKQQLTKKLIIQ